jgi:hypothetical protein
LLGVVFRILRGIDLPKKHPLVFPIWLAYWQSLHPFPRRQGIFLSKGNDIYYFWYDDEDGRKRKISMRARLRSDALKSLRSFDERRKAIRRNRMQLLAFAVDAVRYAETVVNQ